jgi:hypothetical protein
MRMITPQCCDLFRHPIVQYILSCSVQQGKFTALYEYHLSEDLKRFVKQLPRLLDLQELATGLDLSQYLLSRQTIRGIRRIDFPDFSSSTELDKAGRAPRTEFLSQ